MQTLAFHDVTVTFGRVEALRRLSLRVDAGRVLLLAGPNGAGKSTLIRVLLGLVVPDRGTLTVDEQPARVDRALRERIGYLPESVAFAESLTGREVVSFFRSARGVAKSRVGEVLERVGLTYAADRQVRGYSRGMRQRLGLAVALVATPDILVLDEPTGGLDQDGLTLVWSILDEWRAAGRIVLMASHEIALLEHRVDRLALLASASLVADGSPAALRRSAGLPLRVHLELDPEQGVTKREALLEAARGLSLHAEQKEMGCVEAEVEPGGLLALLELRTQFPGAIRDLRVQEPPFDEVYRKLLTTVAA